MVDLSKTFIMSSYTLVKPKGKVIMSKSVVRIRISDCQQTTKHASGQTSAVYITITVAA